MGVLLQGLDNISVGELTSWFTPLWKFNSILSEFPFVLFKPELLCFDSSRAFWKSYI
jgi:hypothetical protein